jgi:hypothetical protein
MDKLDTLPVGVTLSQTKSIVCESCSGQTFNQVSQLRIVPGTLTVSKSDAYFVVSAFACTICGHIHEAFVPDEIKDVVPVPSPAVIASADAPISIS